MNLICKVVNTASISNVIITHADWLTEWGMLRVQACCRHPLSSFSLSHSPFLCLSLSLSLSLSPSLTGEQDANTPFTGQREREREIKTEIKREIERGKER
jgi:hypothetical protein